MVIRRDTWDAQLLRLVPFSGVRRIHEEALRLEASGVHVVHLELGEPDFDTPAHIKDAAKKALDEGFVHYTSNYGIPELRSAISGRLSTDNNLAYDPDTEIMVTAGAGEAIFLAIMAFLDPGDEVIVPEPHFLDYGCIPRLFGANVVGAPLREDNGFQLDSSDLQRCITPRSKMLIVNTPHNPTGCVFDRETLASVATVAEKNDLLVISDEVYDKIIYEDAKHYSIASFPGMWERTITISGFSKAYSMTGWRVGFAAAPRDLIRSLLRPHQYVLTCACSFAQVGAVAAATGSSDCVRQMVGEFERRRDLLVHGLNQIAGVSCLKPRGAFYAFPNVKKFAKSSEDLADYLLKQARVATVPGSVFGDAGEGYLRLSYANSYERIEEALGRMESALASLAV